jgi:hypothetical protein
MYFCFVSRLEKTKGHLVRKNSGCHRLGKQLSFGSEFASRVATTSGINDVVVDLLVVDVVDLINVDI